MPPFKAGGANTAIQSAHNLAWKLAAVLNGTAGPGVAGPPTTPSDTRSGDSPPASRSRGPSLGLLRLDDDRPQLPAEEECSMFALLIGYQYRSAALFRRARAGGSGRRVAGGGVARSARHPGSARVGAGAASAFRRSTCSVPGSPSSPGTSAGAQLQLRCRPRSAFRSQCIASTARVAGVTGLAPDGALLVRPDDFVGWRAEQLAHRS